MSEPIETQMPLTLADIIEPIRRMAPAGANVTLSCTIGQDGHLKATAYDPPCKVTMTFTLPADGTSMPPER